ncbi:hypothetical protein B0T13DRAFT_473445 [Neurospora crassa]|nr:hypothetical protein B0T13DRAFT_473445 [Neurospora crassa]
MDLPNSCNYPAASKRGSSSLSPSFISSNPAKGQLHQGSNVTKHVPFTYTSTSLYSETFFFADYFSSLPLL